MNWKKLGMLGVVSAAFFAANAEEPAKASQQLAPGKIMLLVADVGTIDTVAKTEEYLTQIKQFNVDSVPRPAPGAAITDPALAKAAGRNEYYIELNRYKRQDAEIAARNRRMEKVLEAVRNSILGGKNRDVVVAKNYLHSFLQPYSDFIGIIDRSNTSIAEVEKMIGGKDQQDVAASTYFLTVILQDLKEESNTVQIGNTMVKRTNYTRKAVANVRDYNGNVIFAIHVVGKSTHRKTSATKNTGHDPASDIMEDILKQIADQVAGKFITRLTVKCSGPKGDEEFDADTVTLHLDGEEFENGSMTIVGNHVVLAECDGYKAIIRPVNLKGGSKGRTISLKFRKNPAPAAAPSTAPATAEAGK